MACVTDVEFSLSEFAPLTAADGRDLRIWRAVAEPASVNITVVAGKTAALVVDTGSSPAQGAAIRAAAEAIAGVPVSHVVVTHNHYDHLFGLAGFGEVTSIAHESVAEEFAHPTPEQAAELAETCADMGFDATEIAVPNRTISMVGAIDVGGRRVEVLHPGRAHTSGDLVVVVPDAGVVVVGDLVEEAAPPSYGPDSWAGDWATTLDTVIGLLDDNSRVIVGHGDAVDREYVIGARSAAAAVAHEIDLLVQKGVPLEQAEQQGHWAHPYPYLARGVVAEWDRARARAPRGGRPTLPLA